MKLKNSPTIRDVAKLAGVSVATVSRYLNNSSLLTPTTAQRVKETMDDLNYVPHPVARNLATRRTNTIGLLLQDIGGSFYAPLLRGIEAVSSEAGYDLLIHTTRGSDLSSIPKRALTEYNTDGLLVFVNAIDKVELTRLSQIAFPVVLMFQSPPDGLAIPMVTIENELGAYQMVDHLIKVHQRMHIAFLRGPAANEDSVIRERGYRLALADNDIPYTPQLVSVGNFEADYAREAVKKLLEAGHQFDAIFCGDDDNAIGALQALREAGINVPGQVSIGGFDDSVFARLCTPPLTTIRAPIENVGRMAVRQLISLIHGEQVDQQTILPIELIRRQSCGCDREQERRSTS